MKTNNETKMNDYVQPDCKVIQVDLQQIIAQSGGTEDYSLGNTDDWFSK